MSLLCSEQCRGAAAPLDNSPVYAMDKTVLEQPKLAFLPEGQRGETEFLGKASADTLKRGHRTQNRGRGARPRVTAAKVTFKTEPVS